MTTLKDRIAQSDPDLNSLIPLGWRELLREKTGLSRNSITKMLRGEMGSDERIKDLLVALDSLIEEYSTSMDNLRNVLVKVKSEDVFNRQALAQKSA